MPKETFLKLPNEKKEKIIKAAQKEFERVPIEEASIKNIVEDAEIARGSFYQYFESKEDLLRFYIK
ncbi:TetR/AcrR family transcriptional regulator [bacterium]|nr:TetR/AcrR family transcriptional regulator [bacterium]